MFDKWKGFQKQNKPSIDEHDEPTEPLPQPDVAAFAPTIPNTQEEAEAIPAPKITTHPFPHRFSEPVPAASANSVYPVYPVLPPKPNIVFGTPPGGQDAQKTNNAASGFVGARRKIVPYAVGMGFVAIQLLLLVRFFLKLFTLPVTNWIEVIYEVSNVFVLPFHILFLVFSVPQLYTVELYTLVAIVGYGMISRLLVHILKVLFKANGSYKNR